MKITLNIQDAIKTMGVTVSLQRRDITRPEFWLDPAIFLNDCYIDGKPYEINLHSRLRDGRRYYKLPIFVGTLELSYDAKLRRDESGRLILSDDSGWLPVWPDSETLREVSLRYPIDDVLLSNYETKTEPAKEGFRTSQLTGVGPCLIILGPFNRRIHYAHHYYLIDDLDVELFDKFMRETKLTLAEDWGRPDRLTNHFLDYDRPLGSRGILEVTKPELLHFDQMPRALSRLVAKAYPVAFGDYFRLFSEPFYDYLAWRALRAVMSPSEQSKLLSSNRSGRGPLVELSDLGSDGLAFFKALEDQVGQKRFVETIRDIMQAHRHSPLSLVHFINCFAQDEPTRQLLEHWLFMGR